MSATTERTADLLLNVDRRRGSVVSSLQGALRAAIHAGRLREGDALPPTRRLAAELGVARATVVEAYARLAAEGFVTSHAGSATRVAVGAGSEPIPADVERDSRSRDSTSDRVVPTSASSRTRRGRASWRASFGTHPRRSPTAIRSAHRPCARRWLRTSDARVPWRPRPTASSSPAVSPRASRSCAARWPVAETAPWLSRTRDRTRWSASRSGAPASSRCRSRSTTAGIDVAALERSGASAVLVTPAHQYPTGSVLSADRRRALVRWARPDRRLVIEDDYDAEFRYDRLAVAALQGLAPRRVAYLGSASKLLAPGLRLGWLVPPDWLRVAVAEEKQYDDYGSPSLDQLALAALIDEGTLGRHVRRARLAYRHRRDATLTAIARHLPGWQARGVAAGLQVLIQPLVDLPGTDRRAGDRAPGLPRRHLDHRPGELPPSRRGPCAASPSRSRHRLCDGRGAGHRCRHRGPRGHRARRRARGRRAGRSPGHQRAPPSRTALIGRVGATPHRSDSATPASRGTRRSTRGSPADRRGGSGR